MELDALSKVVLVFPPVDPGEIGERWARFRELTSPRADWSSNSDLSQALVAFFAERDSVEFVTCRPRDDEDCYRLALERALAAVMLPDH